MSDDQVRPLETDEILRVMDAAQVIQARKARMERHDAFDRDAVIREIQVIYEGLGDLVDEDTIGKALDTYLDQRHAFVPPPPGFRTRLASLYVNRGRIARRVLMPLAALVALVWGGAASIGLLQQRSLTREAARLDAQATLLTGEHEARLQILASLRASPLASRLPPAEAEQFEARLRTADGFLSTTVERLSEYPAPPEEEIDRPSVDARRVALLEIQNLISGADEEMSRAGDWIDREQRFQSASDRTAALIQSARSLEAPAVLRQRFEEAHEAATGALSNRDLPALETALARLESAVGDVGALSELTVEATRLSTAIPTLAEEPAAVDLGRRYQSDARSFQAAADVENLRATVESWQALEVGLTQEYEVVITGGVWRFSNDDPGIRNYYLIVETRGPGGQPVSVPITNEEDGTTRSVSTWAERVPQATYDRVAADKQDNDIVDIDEFGTKRRGYLSVDRLFDDLGQITSW